MRAQSATFDTSTAATPPVHDSIGSDADPGPAEASCRDLLEALRAVVDRAVHLLAAMLGGTRAVLTQREIPHKINVITAFAPLLDELDLSGALVSADALHTQRAHARYLVEDKGAGYLLTVKEKQPGLFAQLNALPWAEVPVAHVEHDRGHGRSERRTIHVLPAPDTITFPHAAQAFLVERYIADLAGNPTSAIAVLRRAGHTNIAQGLRWASYNFNQPPADPARPHLTLPGPWDGRCPLCGDHLLVPDQPPQFPHEVGAAVAEHRPESHRR